MNRLAIATLALIGCSTSPSQPSPVEYAACLGNAPASGLGAYDAQFIARVEDSSYVVRATVTQVHASTLPDPGDTTHTVIAHVDSVVYADAEIQQLGDAPLDTITIDLTGGDLDVGASVFLLATLEEYNGGALEVAEITRVDTVRFPNVATDIPRIETLLAANPLYARIASSVQIVSGVVESVGSASPGSSEHSPAWRLSNLTVDTTLCSGTDALPLTAAGFASSIDVAWYQAPKLIAGQSAILLLHHAEVPVPFSDDTPDLFVVNPLDVHALSDQASIAALLATPPSLP